MRADFNFFPPQKSRFFAISPPKVDSKKSVKYISTFKLTTLGDVRPAAAQRGRRFSPAISYH
jgi:hypothetical protein